MTNYEKEESLRELISDGVEALKDPATQRSSELGLFTINFINKAREQLADLQGSKKHKVEIRFGSDSAQSDMYESEDDWEEFTFDTEAELTAFMDGMSAMDGWDGFDQKE